MQTMTSCHKDRGKAGVSGPERGRGRVDGDDLKGRVAVPGFPGSPKVEEETGKKLVSMR